jgi:tRNA (mo5U34)-methyltransferase
MFKLARATQKTQTQDEVAKQMHALGWWYQHFQFPNGLRTGNGKEPGYDAEARWKFIEPYVPSDLTGKTVLDLGGNAGFFSIQMKLRGAKKCTLVDPFLEFLKQAKFAAGQFGVKLNLVNDDAHTYCLQTEERFDYVIFLGLLYHLKYPGLVLDRLAEMTKERIFIQSDVVGHIPKDHLEKSYYIVPNEGVSLEDPLFPKLSFVENLYNSDPTNWWLPNFTALAAMVRSAGLKILSRPHPQVIIAEPERYFGKVVLKKLVFPRYAKKDGAVFPGPQVYDRSLWQDLIRRARQGESDEPI